MYTEDEARQKWCPFARYSIRSSSFNRAGGQDDPYIACRCLGARCMAWRSEMAPYIAPGSDPLATKRPEKTTGRGYCGLAGRPE